MALLKYLQQEGPVRECGALSKKETEQVNQCVRRVLVPSSARENAKAGQKRSATRGTYTGYTPKERAKIGRYAAENGPARAPLCTHRRVDYAPCWRDSHPNCKLRRQTSDYWGFCSYIVWGISPASIHLQRQNRALPPPKCLFHKDGTSGTATTTGQMKTQ